jgi:hypothetical protein
MKNLILLVGISATLIGCGGGGGSSGGGNGGGNTTSTPAQVSSTATSTAMSVAASSQPTAVSSESTLSSTANSTAVSVVPSSQTATQSSQSSLSSTATSSSATPPTAGHYLPIGANNRATEDLLLINKMQPATPITLEQSLSNGYLTIPAADYSATTGLSNLTTAYVVYIKEGNLYKVDLNPIGAAPAPVLLSTEVQAASTCIVAGSETAQFLTSYNDYVAESSVIVYSARLGDSCVTHAVSVEMTATSSPINLGAKEIVSAYLNTANGRLAGFLIKDGASLAVVDTQFNNATDLASITSDVQVIASSNKGVLLMIDGAVRRFDFAAKSLSSTQLTYPDTNINLMGASDSNAFYWSGPEVSAEGTATGNRAIYKLSDSSSALSFSKLYSTNQSQLQLFDLTTDTIVARNTDGFFTLNKSSAAMNSLNVPSAAVILGSNGNRVFYWNININQGSQSIFGSIATNNSNIFDIGSAGIVAVVESTIGLNTDADVDNFMILDYADGQATMASGELKLVNPSNGKPSATLGTLPDVGYNSSYFNNARYGVITLCKQSTQMCDAYFHTNEANSMVRLTSHVD